MILEIIGAALGSAALFTFIQFLITRHDNKKGETAFIKNELKEIREKQAKGEKDELRTQLLLMLADYPEETVEIMKIAEHYFSDLDGNWYLTSLFNKWLIARNIAKPEWFKG